MRSASSPRWQLCPPRPDEDEMAPEHLQAMQETLSDGPTLRTRLAKQLTLDHSPYGGPSCDPGVRRTSSRDVRYAGSRESCDGRNCLQRMRPAIPRCDQI